MKSNQSLARRILQTPAFAIGAGLLLLILLAALLAPWLAPHDP